MNALEKLNIPDGCGVNQFIAKKNFYENVELSKSDIDLFTDIKKITVLYQLSSDKINIPAYVDEVRSYPFINIFEVQLSKDTKTKRLAEIIMRSIPSPMVLIFDLENKYQVFVAHQRTSLSDRSKNTIEEIVSTDWLDENNLLFDKLNIKQMRFTNFYDLYSDVVDIISIYNAGEMLQSDHKLSGEESRELMNELNELDFEINSLRAKVKKEIQFNKKMELNVEIKKLEKRRNALIGGNKQ